MASVSRSSSSSFSFSPSSSRGRMPAVSIVTCILLVCNRRTANFKMAGLIRKYLYRLAELKEENMFDTSSCPRLLIGDVARADETVRYLSQQALM